MTAGLVLLPFAWGALVLSAAAACRRTASPAPRLPNLAEATDASDAHVAPGLRLRIATLVDRGLRRAGEPVLRVARRRDATVAERRRAGGAIVVGSLAFLVHPLAGVALFLAGWALPGAMARKQRRRRETRIEAELPDLVDLFLLAVDAGLTVPLAVDAVARRAPGLLAAEFDVAVAEADRGRRLADALEAITERAGETVRPLTAVLIASERYGTPVAAALERLAVEVRISAQRRAEEAARRVPVTLLFPLVLCILPAFALLTVAPLIANGLRSLRL